MIGWIRYEIGADDGDLDLAVARKIVAAHGGRRLREAYRDMGTWRGTNQPRVLAFSLKESLASRARRIKTEYCDTTGRRCFVETRREKV